MESPTSSIFSLTSAPSMRSDINHSPNCAGEKRPDLSPHDPANCTPSSLREASVVPEHDGKPFFDAGDGDIRLEIGGTSFEVHKYLLKRFNLLKVKVCERSSDDPLLVQGDRGIAGDFQNTFRVLYATVFEGPFEFDNTTLVSSLRIATMYDYPALRTYAIGLLERAQLTAIERIKISREFALASWVEPAYAELCGRDEPITREEANVLGIDSFVQVAEIRERVQRTRGKEVDARQHKETAVQGAGKLNDEEPKAAGTKTTQDSEDLLPEPQTSASFIGAQGTTLRIIRTPEAGPVLTGEGLNKARRAIRIIWAYYSRYRLRFKAPRTATEDRILKLHIDYKQDIEEINCPTISVQHFRRHERILLGYMPHVAVYLRGLERVNQDQKDLTKKALQRVGYEELEIVQLRMTACSNIRKRLRKLSQSIAPGSKALRHIQSLHEQVKGVDDMRKYIAQTFGEAIIPADLEQHYRLGVWAINSLQLS